MKKERTPDSNFKVSQYSSDLADQVIGSSSLYQEVTGQEVRSYLSIVSFLPSRSIDEYCEEVQAQHLEVVAHMISPACSAAASFKLKS
ncbi:hypothetical protein BELL_0904g00060 [Botrytis elliptica]|uniref:Uncharacterized protein n=1 Tax=Botrytis elliptica TaxID=278938 RepID=A0A4Z1J0W1_9HELO|nr:hypothetical protein BELL_0904g00060 [Botrytis elliptica]